MNLYPMFLNLEGRLGVVIGAGEVAQRKIAVLISAGARVRVIAPEAAAIDGVDCVSRTYKRGDLEGATLVIAATDDESVNREVYSEAVGKGILINVVDNPPLCTFQVPSVVHRGDLQIAISTGGKCPALAKKIRQDLECAFGPEYESLVKVMDEARTRIKEWFSPEDRKRVLKTVLDDGKLLCLLKDGRIEETRKRIENLIFEEKTGKKKNT